MKDNLTEDLLNACWHGDLTKVKELVTAGADVNGKDNLGMTPLNSAAGQGHSDIVKFLVENGANINLKDGADLSPIINAATAGFIDVVIYLSDKGVRITDELLSYIQMKVNILEENAESGMVLPEGVQAWKDYLNVLINLQKTQGHRK